MHILFLCTGNSCRSQMAEGWMRHLGAELAPELNLKVSSAGLEAHGVNPRAVACMQQQGIDISSHTSDILTDSMLADADLIVTVCSHADANCPLVPPTIEKRHIPFDDPAKATGTEQEIADCFTRVCGEIRDALQSLVLQLKEKAA
ncbi:MAG: arsenate reductase ArsC [Pseudomonadales bacterium]|nr:arsenate reductase ArsC [Pseudomonadales bacterium]